MKGVCTSWFLRFSSHFRNSTKFPKISFCIKSHDSLILMKLFNGYTNNVMLTCEYLIS